MTESSLAVSNLGKYYTSATLIRRAHGPDASEAVHVVCIVEKPSCDSIAAPHQQEEPMRWVHRVALAWQLVLCSLRGIDVDDHDDDDER
ncbi:uncharacterized protein N7458_007415 [Penicillium daleae]|uniref:Uncharacterized protein n=1 Tax=Penicillium daleae TaxID=63821 RepID=A0AAD6C3G4_9EURO|nr:uncharacterized protein N7458_007415 [Penicillium daleae]KAJ5443543.1 hypothetical protein N7458_007415 [Penicillium daleae]